MPKKLIYFSFLIIFFSACEEYYTPDIEKVNGQLVVEAQITNDVSKNYVHLTKTRDFYDQQPPGVVSGARVELVEINGAVAQGVESGKGYFNFSTVPRTGKNYKLRIIFQNNNYESEVVTMPPLPVIDNIYAEQIMKQIYSTDAYGTPQLRETKQIQVYIDAPVTDALSHYRSSTRAIIEWYYLIPETYPPNPKAPTIIYGWKSYTDNIIFNIAGPKKFSQNEIIKKHPLLTLWINASEYLLPDTVSFGGSVILIIDQYGTTKGSFDFHEKMNNQFSADGTLFDPIQTQIYGNIKCTTDPSKIAFGYFDLNSYRQNRYFLNLFTQQNNVKLRQILRYPYIPDTGQIIQIIPEWWE